MEVTRLFDIHQYQLENYPQEDALAGKVDGKWIKTSTQEFIDQGTAVTKALLAHGIKPGDTIAMISNNRPEWSITDLGILQSGAVSVPIYPTISAADYEYIFNDAAVKICFVSDQELLEKVNEIKDNVPSLKRIVSFEKIDGVEHFSEFIDSGKSTDDSTVDSAKKSVKAEDLATLIYTSGTTGKPKGVMLSHNNLVANVIGSWPRLPVDQYSRALSFLPLCHVYERMVVYLFFYSGVSVYYAESLETIGDNMKEVHPHVFTAVPRLLEKVYDKIVAKGADLTGIKKSLFFWALSLGHRWEPYGANGALYEFKLSIAKKLIFSKWQEALGGNVKVIASGSAALQPRLARVFNAAGIPLMEGYGLTESSPVITVNDMKNKGFRIGTVGKPLENVEVKIAEDGEILARGPNIMQGYYNKPEETQKTIDSEGWLHTGDIGELSADGFLRITDRKKEIFKTSGGKYIAPQVMENKFKESRFIEQIMVIGENEKHPAALVVPDLVFMTEWCERKKIKATTLAEMANNPKVVERIGREIDHYNKDFGNYEKVKQFRICSNAWSIEGGELTPTMKVRRKKIMEKYNDLVEEIYR